jgi:quinol monooxygenase YgiN
MTAASSAEQGRVSCAFNFDLSAPHLVRIVEVWRDQAALDAQFQTAHPAAFRAAVAGKIKMPAADVCETQAQPPLLS